MTKDGYARYIADRGAVLQRRSESVHRATRVLDAAKLELIPQVQGDLVLFRCGQRWMTYGIGPDARGLIRARYLPERSHPIEIIDPAARPLTEAALDAWLSAQGPAEERPIDWHYAASIDADLTAEERLTVRALQALDVGRRGVVTASRRQVSETRARIQRVEGM